MDTTMEQEHRERKRLRNLAVVLVVLFWPWFAYLWMDEPKLSFLSILWTAPFLGSYYLGIWRGYRSQTPRSHRVLKGLGLAATLWLFYYLMMLRFFYALQVVFPVGFVLGFWQGQLWRDPPLQPRRVRLGRLAGRWVLLVLVLLTWAGVQFVIVAFSRGV